VRIEVYPRLPASKLKPDVPYLHFDIAHEYTPELFMQLPDNENRIFYKRFAFFDTDDRDHPRRFNSSIAKRMLRFLNENMPKIELIVLNCTAGESRSAGVAVALEQIINRDSMAYQRYSKHNRLVASIMLEEFQENFKDYPNLGGSLI
jgi:protein-tyrosine phosphatase